MTPLQFFALLVVSILCLVAGAQVPLVNEWVGANCGPSLWCSSSSDFWAGLISLFAIFYSGLMVVSVKF